MRNQKHTLFLRLTIIVLFATSMLWVGCDNNELSPIDSFATQAERTLTKANPAVQQAIDAQNKNISNLINIPGVVGTGIGLNPAGIPVIKVFLENPGVGNIPDHVDGVPVIKEVTGMFVIYSDPTAYFARPVPIGVSTGHPDITAGTIGCRVKDDLGNVYALSNNHVYANSNDANIGDSALQPGSYDGGQDPADAIGTLYDFEPILFNGSNNYMDAALAITTTSMVGFSTPDDGYGTPGTTPVIASIGLPVQKFGRTTHWTQGEVSEISVTVDVCYKSRGPFRCVKLARFVDQITITPGTFSDGGDSGSLIVTDDDNNNPVALLFAGSDTRTIGSPIGPVLQRFNVSIDNSDGGAQINYPPTANFTYTADELTAYFTDESSDPNGDNTINTWDWTFGDGETSTSQNPTHTYSADGTYPVTLIVTDNEGATDEVSKDVIVTTASSDGINLSATGYKVKGRQKADLEWNGAVADVDVYRDGNYLLTTVNDGFYTDNIDNVGGGSYTYYITDGTETSNEATITF